MSNTSIKFNCQSLHFSHESRTENTGRLRAVFFCFLIITPSEGEAPPVKFLVEVLSC